MKTRDIHKGGRPPMERPIVFYTGLLAEYETQTTAQMAKSHGVSRATISRWLKIAREVIADGIQKS